MMRTEFLFTVPLKVIFNIDIQLLDIPVHVLGCPKHTQQHWLRPLGSGMDLISAPVHWAYPSWPTLGSDSGSNTQHYNN